MASREEGAAGGAVVRPTEGEAAWAYRAGQDLQWVVAGSGGRTERRTGEAMHRLGVLMHL